MGYHGYEQVVAIRGISEGLKSIAKSLEKIATNLGQNKSPNTYNVYVTTSGAETTRDVASAVQQAIKRASSGNP